ncbi:inositol monophosphatase [Mycolicibacterium aurum]|uniref:Inositol monophosphatase n=1 Tax=Mycolicibacterium aurum TaxID=1791 RepID=A0A3S4RJV1_MYCAU|nr:inositol monophosphatase family protein [Mycolicibacterium aurum]VEG52328.1 inositol monophosphatase [Mycolicibacterium aurum]
MKLPESSADFTRDVLEEVVTHVSRVLPTVQSLRYEITWKADDSPVTAADVFLEGEIESLLRERLPDLSFVGEESYRPGFAPGSGWLAVLDPIDGTENFCSGFKEWGVSLSLWHDHKHSASLLLLPELGMRILSGDQIERVRSRIVGFSSSINDELAAQLSKAGEARIMGCAVYNMVNVIRGAYARFVNPVGAYSWDLLAGVALATEYGCEVTLDGRPYAGELLEAGRRYRVDIRHGRRADPG